jgi:hypothetical protein
MLCAVLTWIGCNYVDAKSPLSLDILRRDGYGSVQLLEPSKNILLIPAEINGEKIRLLLDTGFAAKGITVGVTPQSLHIVPEKGGEGMMSASGKMTGIGHGIAQSIVMGNVRINGAPIFFGSFISRGFVGRGFLRTNSAIVDLTNLQLYLRPPGKGRRVDLTPALTRLGMAAVPFTETPQGSFVVDVEVNGAPAKMALDTGAQLTTLDVRFARQARTRGWGRSNVRQIDAAGVISSADFAGTKSFKIDGVPIRTPEVAVTNFAGYTATGGKLVGVLGLDVLGMNWGIIDFGQQKFYFTKAN